MIVLSLLLFHVPSLWSPNSWKGRELRDPVTFHESTIAHRACLDETLPSTEPFTAVPDVASSDRAAGRLGLAKLREQKSHLGVHLQASDWQVGRRQVFQTLGT